MLKLEAVLLGANIQYSLLAVAPDENQVLNQHSQGTNLVEAHAAIEVVEEQNWMVQIIVVLHSLGMVLRSWMLVQLLMEALIMEDQSWKIV